MASNTRPHPFFRLPRELRDQIYAWTFAGTIATDKRECPELVARFGYTRPRKAAYLKFLDEWKAPTATAADHNAGLLLACKQTCSEAVHAYFAAVTLHFYSPVYCVSQSRVTS